MRANDGSRTGGEILVDQLIAHGTEHVFCVPGESYLAALDAFHDRNVTVTVCRAEGGAAMMAEAVGKATGRPGICFVTRGPGATNASPGIHIARQDFTPMIVFVGQVARDIHEREAFQELDYRPCSARSPNGRPRSTIRRAFPNWSRALSTATSGRPGPVVIALPEDMLTERVIVPDAPRFERGRDLARGAHRHVATAEALWAAESGGASAAAAGRTAPARPCSVSPSASPCRSSTPFGAGICSTRRIRTTPAISAWRRSRSRCAHQGGGCAAADRRAAGRNALAGLHADRHPGACADARACASRRRGARPRLSSASAINASPTAFGARALEGLQAPNDTPGARGPGLAHAAMSPGARSRRTVPGAVNVGEIMV